MRLFSRCALALSLVGTVFSCSSDPDAETAPAASGSGAAGQAGAESAAGQSASAGSAGKATGAAGKASAGAPGGGGEGGQVGGAGGDVGCAAPCFDPGDPQGHPDPFGAKAAGQARAARITDKAQIIRHPEAKMPVNVGDFILTNEKIALYIEDKGFSDGYTRFGGEVLAVDKVGDDGKPMGLSVFCETLMPLSREMIEPTSVSVLNDGSDGKAAIVRVSGVLKPIPFLDFLKGLFNDEYGVPAVYDYVLEPGAEKVTIRLGVRNTGEEEMIVGNEAMFGFFQGSQSRLVTPEFGYSEPKGKVSWVGFDGGDFGFAYKKPEGQLTFMLTVSGFSYFSGPGFKLQPGEAMLFDYVDLYGGGPHLDGLREAVLRGSGAPSPRTVTGKVLDGDGNPVAGVNIYELDGEGKVLSRTTSGDDGSYTMHAPATPVTLLPYKQGYPMHDGAALDGSAQSLDIAFAKTGMIEVEATTADGGEGLPVRVQVIPTEAPKAPLAQLGEKDEANGRLLQIFAVDGKASLVVPPGEHKVVVSRGYEYELVEQTVQVTSGQTTKVTASLVHSVDTTGVMCADFHIHSFHSPDSSDPIVHKVKGALADGLDIPVSSEHEWVVDFQPVIEKLGAAKWAFGMPSEELTTFTWGHFGVIPLKPKPDQPNMGALDWIGRKPAEVFDLVHQLPEKPVLIVNHPSGSGFGAYFPQAGFKRDKGIGKDGMWSDNFEAVEVYNDSNFDSNRDASVADWFALLNRGLKVWSVGSSDSHSLRGSPVGYPRTCISFGHDDPTKLSPELVRDGVASGNMTISGGLYMAVSGPEVAAGQVVKTQGEPVTFKVRVQAPSWMDASQLEVIVNGKTISEEPLQMVEGAMGPAKVFENEVTVAVDSAAERTWVLFHARGNGDLAPLHPGRKPFAVSNPYYLE